MAASYPTSVKSWSDVVDNNDTIMANHINDAYEEIIAIETDLLSNSGMLMLLTYRHIRAVLQPLPSPQGVIIQ
jgi:hypothetical protein